MAVSADLRNFLRSYRAVPTLSVYLSGGLTDPAGQRAWRVELRHALAVARAQLSTLTSRERLPFERCVARVEQRLPDAHALHQAGGWWCVCAVDGTTLDMILTEHVATQALWRMGPVILPYLLSQHDAPVFVLQLGRDEARIARLRGPQLQEIDHVTATVTQGAGDHMGSAPRMGFHMGTVGETLTDRAQRRQRDARQQLLTQVHRRVAALLEGHGLLVLTGPSEVTHHFVSALSPSVAPRTICTTALLPDRPEADVVRHAQEALSTLQSNRQLAWFMALRERLYIDRHAAVGLPNVQAAITMGAAEEVALTDEFITAHPVDAERLAQDAVLHGASMALIPANVAALVNRDAHGVAATLRYALPTTTPLASLTPVSATPSMTAHAHAVASMPETGLSL